MGALSSRVPAAHQRYPVRAEEDGWAARRAAGRMAAAAGIRAGEVEIVAAELAGNILRHAGGDGYLLCQASPGCLDLIAADRGPGLLPADLPPAGTGPRPALPVGGRSLGVGLGAVQRLATVVDYYSSAAGTVVLARFGDPGWSWPGVARWGAVSVPLDGTGECGDGWLASTDGQRLTAVVIDGLGHGPAAAAAAQAGIAALAGRRVDDPGPSLVRPHEAMRGTRGGVLGIAVGDPAAGELAYAGAGNITGWVLHGGRAQGLLSREGTAGAQAAPPRARETTMPWPPGATLILASDGIRSLHDLSPSYPGLFGHDPVVAASVLYRDNERGTDDATVLVITDLRHTRP